MCKSLWRRAEALKRMGNHSGAICDYEKISQCRSEHWSRKGYSWMMELLISPWDWGERSAEVNSKKMKQYIIPNVDVIKREYTGKFMPRAGQCDAQVGDYLYILGGKGQTEEAVERWRNVYLWW